MRKNARWAHSGVASILGSSFFESRYDDDNESLITKLVRNGRPRESIDNPLIMAFAKLRSDLLEFEFQSLDSQAILSPFLNVVRSQATTGSITLTALTSVSKFLSLNVVSEESPGIRMALQELAVAITHCRFQATDQNEDDAVLLKILSLMEEVVCSPRYSQFLNDQSVAEIIETCLSMACQMRRGDVLRRAAEMTLMKLSQAVFSKLHEIEPEQVPDNPLDQGEVKIDSSMNQQTLPEGVEDIGSKITVSAEEEEEDEIGEKEATDGEENSEDKYKTFGIASIREVLRVFVSILDQANFHQYTDSTRIMALRIINVAIEVSGHDIARHEPLLAMASTTLMKHLFQLVRSDNVMLVQPALRLLSSLLYTMRKHLKLQQEFLISYLLTTLSPVIDIPREPDVDSIFYDGVPSAPKLVKNSSAHAIRTQSSTPVNNRPGTPATGASVNEHEIFASFRNPDVREAMIEALSNLVRLPFYFSDLYVNYDCDVSRADLCEDLIGFLCRSAYPDSATWSTPSVPPLCLEAVLAFLVQLTLGISGDKNSDPNSVGDVSKLVEEKAQKKLAILAAEAFNEKPKKGISFLVENGLIENDSPANVARWLKESGRVDKITLGEFLSKPSNQDVLECFLTFFDFSGVGIDEGLRDLLSSFRLPGESALIEKIFEQFAHRYFNCEGNSEVIASEDAAYVLSYAIIMLNTDLYNTQNKRRMTVDQFKNNLRQTNDGKDYPPEFLEGIYKNIKHREIIMPDEHHNDESFAFAWKSMLLQLKQAGPFTSYRTHAFDKHIFQANWRPIATTLAFVFATATDDAVFTRVITAFDQLARIASHYEIPEVIDHVIECLSRMSVLAAGDQSTPIGNTEIILDDEKTSITVSDLSVPFGSDYKAQMASIILFGIVKAHSHLINKSWSQVMPSIANLYLYGLIPSAWPDISPEFYGAKEPLPKISPALTINKAKAGKDVGLFSALSSYLVGGNGSSDNEPTDEEIDATLNTIDCIKSCRIDEVLTKMLTLGESQQEALIDWLFAHLPKLVDESNAHKQAYYAVTLYYLELAVILCIKGQSEQKIAKALSRLYVYLVNWEGLDSEFLTRAIGYDLALLAQGKVNRSDLESHLSVLSKTIKPTVLSTAAPDLLQNTLRLLENGIEPSDKNDDFWRLVIVLATNEETISDVYSRLQQVKPTLDNFSNILEVYSQIANMGALKDTQDFAVKSIGEIQKLGSSIDELGAENWTELWKSFISILIFQCTNPNKKVRAEALKHLQRYLLSPDLHEHSMFAWPMVFDDAMFPLITFLLRPEVFETDIRGMPDTRQEAASLTCKLFLQYIQTSSNDTESIMNVWTKILDTLDRLVTSSMALQESIIESLKNVLLVVAADKESAYSGEKFWDMTWSKLDSFLPGLREQIVPVIDDEKKE
ncbi:ARF guanine-nucleotide exchange factor 2 [Trichomonascus vanleenenianus]|uniref:Sec7 domain-containing protein n=1 Tax=Trichomonascus vanleenenianus TaxID=2268995 RepID=UPI003ECA39FE